MGVFPSGQWGQTVNLLLFSFGGSNPPAPTKNSSVVMTLEFLFAEDGVAALGGGQDALSLVWRGFIASLS